MQFPRFSRLAIVLIAAPLLLIALALLAPAATEAQPVRTPQAYLPLLARPGGVTLEFATGVVSTTLEPIGATTTFPLGTDYIYVTYVIEGLQGSQYRLDFTYADGETLTGDTGTVTSNRFRDWNAYCITTSGTCSFGRVQLDPGPYIARIFINGQPRGEWQAVIQ